MTVFVRCAMPLLALAYLTPAWAQQPTLALVGGRIIDGYGGPPIENGVILIAGERITAVTAGARSRYPPECGSSRLRG